MFNPHEDSDDPQFEQNVAVDELGKPHREQVSVILAGGAVASAEAAAGGFAAAGAADGDAAPGGGIGYPQADGPGTAAYRCVRPADTRSFVFPTIQKNITYPTSAKPGGRKTPPTRSEKSRLASPWPTGDEGFEMMERIRTVTEPTTAMPMTPSAGIRMLAMSDHRLVSGG